MDIKHVLDTIKTLKESSKKRNFTQTYDLVISLREIDLKQPDQKVDVFLQLPHDRGKKIKVCAFVGDELAKQAAEVCDKVIVLNDFINWAKDKKALKKLGRDFDFFIAQANLMGQIAGSFGRVLGTLGKMPNPKAGGVFPPNAQLKPLVERFRKLVRLITKNELAVKVMVGKENIDEKYVAENIMAIYNAVVHALPNGEHNVKHVSLKLTMSNPIEIGEAKVEKVVK